MIVNEKKEIDLEVEDFYENLEIVEMSTWDCIDFFGFYEYYNDIVMELDH